MPLILKPIYEKIFLFFYIYFYKVFIIYWCLTVNFLAIKSISHCHQGYSVT